MLDHVGLNVSDYERSHRFYEAALAPLGWKVVMGGPDWEGEGYGEDDKPVFWIMRRDPVGSGAHIAFHAPSRDLVDAFHAAALEAGGTDNGGPGVREQYHPTYYGAFVLDPDGNNVEAVCHAG